MPSVRKAKQITNPNDVEFLLNLTEEDLLKQSTVMEMFADFSGNDKPRFHPYDTVTIPPGSYQISSKNKNKKSFNTTVGIWIFNKVFIEKDLNDLFGYINRTLTSGDVDDIRREFGYAIMEDDSDIEKMSRFIMKQQFYTQFVSILAPGFTEDLLLINRSIEKKKLELINKYKDRLIQGDAKAMDEIEEELIAYAKELLKDDPSSDMFNSGARASWGNQFKSMFISRGAAKDPDPNKGYNIIMSSYMDGIKKEEYAALANTLSAGPYSRAKKTEVGGYWVNLFISATQHIVLKEAGSDCGTKRNITITLNKQNLNDFMYSYIVEGGRLVELTRKNRDKYKDKTVKMRYSSLCECKDGICNKCFGNMPYRLYTDNVNKESIKNIGCATPQLGSRIKNIYMKAFHDGTIKFSDMNVMKAFGFE